MLDTQVAPESAQVIPGPAEVEFFEKNGFWISPKIVDDNRLETLRRHMMFIYNENYETGRAPFSFWKPGSGSLRKTDNVHWSDFTFRDLVQDPVIGEIAAALLRTPIIRLWHDQLLFKPGLAPGVTPVPANVGWHQDYHYWQCAQEPTLVTAWVAFDDVDLSNGCMHVVRGSNHWGLVDVNNFFEQDLQKQEETMTIPTGAKFEPVPLIMKAGQVSFHHAMSLHGSGPNNTTRPRRSIAIHLMAGDTRYKAGTPADEHMNVQLFKPKDGDIFAGSMFPVLYNKLTA
ncbi:MAG: phytanoyl-CoA dioxygenase family protein [Chloroflexi bacterium]|mgnify:CR=1 FL=1|nr:phytanoyl-CoA dioxygenase family protein [Chloroflexota bacterium]